MSKENEPKAKPQNNNRGSNHHNVNIDEVTNVYNNTTEVTEVTEVTNVTQVTQVTNVVNKGRNIILGTRRKDVLNGTEGDDLIKGFRGNDVLIGRGGSDVLIGDRGRNTYFSASDGAVDTLKIRVDRKADIIKEVGREDRIDLVGRGSNNISFGNVKNGYGIYAGGTLAAIYQGDDLTRAQIREIVV